MPNPNYLMMLEVSRKQAYIFSSKQLSENIARSKEIAYVTDSSFFASVADNLYEEDKNLVYSGGGHTVLQFDDREQARSFAQCVTEAAIRQFHGMEMFAKIIEYDNTKKPADNLKNLSESLERKKAERKASFRRLSFGIEILEDNAHQPLLLNSVPTPSLEDFSIIEPPEDHDYPAMFEKIADGENFLSVVHIDGNAMGNRVNAIYEKSGKDWETCRSALQKFSRSIQADFTEAFHNMEDDFLLSHEDNMDVWNLPFRPVILAGDDVCFITKGSIGLECARLFMKNLVKKKNAQDGKPYSACAGVAMVHTKFPFYRAYDLAEELCSNAKLFGAELDESRSISAMDWHIEFGQMKESLSDLRQDYITEDGNLLQLRPVVVDVPKNISHTEEMEVRSFDHLNAMSQNMQDDGRGIPRSKIKNLRNALKQGETEAEFYLGDREIRAFLEHGFEAEYRDTETQMQQFRRILTSQGDFDRSVFFPCRDGQKRCRYFDAIELMDHCDFFEGV